MTVYFFYLCIYIYFFYCCRLMFQHLLCSYHNDTKSSILFGNLSFNTLLSRAQNLSGPDILTFLCCFQFRHSFPTFLYNLQTLIFKVFFFSSKNSISTFFISTTSTFNLSLTEFVNLVLNS